MSNSLAGYKGGFFKFTLKKIHEALGSVRRRVERVYSVLFFKKGETEPKARTSDYIRDVVFEKSDFEYKGGRVDTISLTFHTGDGNELYFGYISFESFLRAIRSASCRNRSNQDYQVDALS
jgi:hypothetical protein